jgi:hypothetical protein
VPSEVSLEERNPAGTRAAALSKGLDFTRADANPDEDVNRALWATLRGGESMAAPVHAAFVRPLSSGEPDADD